MAITTPYLQHDVDAFNDIKVSALMSDYGFEAYGLLWYIYELLWAEEGVTLPLTQLTFKAIKMQTHTTINVEDFISSAIEYEIFVADGRFFYSDSMIRRLEKLDEKAREISEKRRHAANVRWQKNRDTKEVKSDAREPKSNPSEVQKHAHAMHMQCNSMQSDANNINNLNNLKEITHIVEQARPHVPSIHKDIVDYLNTKTGKQYRSTTKKTQDLIRARQAEGFELKDFQTVVDKKVAEWTGTEFEKFLRPETLFGTKFEGYLNQSANLKPKQDKKRANDFTMSAESERELEEQIKENELLRNMTFLEKNEYFRRKQEAANGR